MSEFIVNPVDVLKTFEQLVEEKAERSVCVDCPAAFALGMYADESSNRDGFLNEARRNESKIARDALENAAGQTACKSIIKQLPELPETVPPTGSQELIEFVSHCPSFAKYLELRAPELT